MSMSADWIALLLTRELDSFQRELQLFPDDASVWRTVPGVLNSAGTLALHVSGNLLYFVGAVLGASGYVRDRTREFAQRDVPRASLLTGLVDARAAVTTVVPGLTDDDLSKLYPATVGGVQVATGLFLLHLSGHLAFHLGQAGYLRRIVTGDSRSTSPLPLQALASGELDRS
jgi:hypothetical protein